MNVKLLGIILVLTVVAYAEACNRGYEPLAEGSSICLKFLPEQKKFSAAYQQCIFDGGALFNPFQLNNCQWADLVKFTAERNFTNGYAWTDSIITNFDPNDPSKTMFTSADMVKAIPCTLARMDNSICHNDPANEIMYLRCKRGICNVINSPDDKYTNPVLCQQTYYD